jgi:catechol 2,3-dioxygenase-like lactoylglutathione lyase family enzyme
MDRFIERMLKEFESGKLSRRQLIAIGATAYGLGEATPAAPSTLGFHTMCVNHISYNCAGTDYGKARDFYVKLFGMDYPPDQDTGAQAYLPFGPKDGGTFMLPRSSMRDPNAGPAPQRGNAGAGAAAGGGGRGAGRGAGAAPADATAGAAPAAGGRGAGRGANAAGEGGGAPAGPVTMVVDQFGITVANWDTKKVETALKKFGLDPKPDGESFHVVDPFGMDLQVCGPKISAY